MEMMTIARRMSLDDDANDDANYPPMPFSMDMDMDMDIDLDYHQPQPQPQQQSTQMPSTGMYYPQIEVHKLHTVRSSINTGKERIAADHATFSAHQYQMMKALADDLMDGQDGDIAIANPNGKLQITNGKHESINEINSSSLFSPLMHISPNSNAITNDSNIPEKTSIFVIDSKGTQKQNVDTQLTSPPSGTLHPILSPIPVMHEDEKDILRDLEMDSYLYGDTNINTESLDTDENGEDLSIKIKMEHNIFDKEIVHTEVLYPKRSSAEERAQQLCDRAFDTPSPLFQRVSADLFNRLSISFGSPNPMYRSSSAMAQLLSPFQPSDFRVSDDFVPLLPLPLHADNADNADNDHHITDISNTNTYNRQSNSFESFHLIPVGYNSNNLQQNQLSSATMPFSHGGHRGYTYAYQLQPEMTSHHSHHSHGHTVNVVNELGNIDEISSRRSSSKSSSGGTISSHRACARCHKVKKKCVRPSDDPAQCVACSKKGIKCQKRKDGRTYNKGGRGRRRIRIRIDRD